MDVFLLSFLLSSFSAPQNAGTLDFTGLRLVDALMFEEICNAPDRTALIILPKLDPPHAGKVLEASWNVLGIIQEWEKRSSNEGRMRHEVPLIIRPIQERDGKQPGEFRASTKPLMEPEFRFDGADSHPSSSVCGLNVAIFSNWLIARLTALA